MFHRILVFIIVLSILGSCGQKRIFLSDEKLSMLKVEGENIDLTTVFDDFYWDGMCVAAIYQSPSRHFSKITDVKDEEFEFVGGDGAVGEHEYSMAFINLKDKIVHTFIIPWGKIRDLTGETCLNRDAAYSYYEIASSLNIKSYSKLTLKKSIND